MAEAKKRKGTALLAVMDENCSSCAGSPICEAHCPVDDCINLLYEELPGGGLKPYRVFVDNRVPINRVVSHGNTVSIYAQDPDGNSVEVYWPSGVDVPQPFGKPMDLTKSEVEIRAQLNQILTEWAGQST